jgi:hypothetical protein
VAAAAALLALALAPAANAASSASPFANWAAVVIAGDWHAHSGGPTEAFDNARRDVAARLTTLGFTRDNVRQFSTRPDRYPDTRPSRTELQPIFDTLTELAEKAPAGCLIYYTSHGGPPGVVMDEDGKQMIVPPGVMAELVNEPPDDGCAVGLLLGRLHPGAGEERPDDPDRGAARPQLVRLQRERQIPLLRRLLPALVEQRA